MTLFVKLIAQLSANYTRLHTQTPLKTLVQKSIMKLFGNVMLRILATFVASALGVIGAGSIMQVDLFTAAAMGGILAVFKVIELLSLAFLEDGKLTLNEINAAFRQTVALKGVEETEDKGEKVKNEKSK